MSTPQARKATQVKSRLSSFLHAREPEIFLVGVEAPVTVSLIKRRTLVWASITAAGLVLVFFVGRYVGRGTGEARPSLHLAGSAGSLESAEIERGRVLARSVCATCHLFPDASLLPRRQWAHHILPQMALWLGVEPVNYESLPDGRILQAAQLFPRAPTISEADWFSIWNYYVSAAPEQTVAAAPPIPVPVGLDQFRARKLNFVPGAPMISLVKIDPLARRLYVGDGYASILAVVRPNGEVEGTIGLDSPPASLFLADDGVVYATLIGKLFPSDVTEGKVVALEAGASAPRVVLAQLRRPTDTAVGDLNGDGRRDMVVCVFGNRLGRLSWFEQLESGEYREHALFDRPGAIRAELRDLNRDGRLDIVVLMAQAREGLYIFYNQGNGTFRPETVLEQHPLFGFASFVMEDMDGDGDLDLLTANGDNGDNPTPHKAYHGLRIYLNNGQNVFTEKWFYPFAGAYKVVAVDFDFDGDRDLAAISFYPDFDQRPVLGFVYLENKGQFDFIARTVAESDAGRWATMDVGDIDGDGDADLALGSFVMGPTTIPVPAATREHWQREGATVLLLENQARPSRP